MRTRIDADSRPVITTPLRRRGHTITRRAARAARFDKAPPGAAADAWGELPRLVPTDDAEIDAFVDNLLSQLTIEERIRLLSGDDPLVSGLVEMANWYNRRPIPAGAVTRVGLPGIRFSDGPRGVVMYRSTAFPTPMARAATFDPELEERIGDAIGVETRSQGANLFAGVCINMLRHPAWGRAQETYGEDPHLLGEMGAALTRGAQRHVMACVKHYAANSMENSRFWIDVRIDQADLDDIYLPHFRRVIDEGVAAVMTAYNRVNGTFCGHHRHLIEDVLRKQWGFEGFVMSDFTFGIRGPRALDAGLDLEMPQRLWFGLQRRRLRRGDLARTTIDSAARRVIRTQARFARRGEPHRYTNDAVASPEHRALAREAATRSIVLLRNDSPDSPTLPFDPSVVRRLAVVGRLAALDNLGDHGSSRVQPPAVVSILDGLRSLAEREGIEIHHDDGTSPDRAAEVARSCDATVTVAGTTWRDEGEWVGLRGGDRSSLALPPDQVRLIDAVGRSNAHHAVVLTGGSAFVTDDIDGVAPALLMAWYPGMEGGHAVADLLFGFAEPEGRLPSTWPTSSTELPPFRRFARRITYGPLHGYRMMHANAQRTAFWFGHGLSYTTFAWGPPELSALNTPASDDWSVSFAIDITNTGQRPGTEHVQTYAPLRLGTHPEALPTLKGFAVARDVKPGETRTVTTTVRVPPHTPRLFVGPSADPLRHHTIRLEGSAT